MKKIELYKCELCNTQYSDPEKAQECESNHKKIVNVSGMQYVSKERDRTGFPLKVMLLMDDGSKLLFERKAGV